MTSFFNCKWLNDQGKKWLPAHIQSFLSCGSKSCFTGQSYSGESTAGPMLASETCCIKSRNLMTYNQATLINFFIIQLEYLWLEAVFRLKHRNTWIQWWYCCITIFWRSRNICANLCSGIELNIGSWYINSQKINPAFHEITVDHSRWQYLE